MKENKIIKISDNAYYVPGYSTYMLTNPIPSITNQSIMTEDDQPISDDDTGEMFTREDFEDTLKKVCRKIK